jgi:hypothetical protein
MKTSQIVLLCTLLAICASAQSSEPISYMVTPSMGVILTNSDTQPLVAVLVHIQGNKTLDVYQHDFYFKDMQFDPGATLDAEMPNDLDVGVTSYKITIVWCQRLDGTQWGDLKEGGKMLAQREATRIMLSKLALYNDADFQSTLSDKQRERRSQMHVLLAHRLQEIKDKDGIAAAHAEVAWMLKNAANRKF